MVTSTSLRLRNDLYERSSGHCEVAGEVLSHSFAVHHRKRRSQGGTDEITNLMIVCHFHHNGGTHSIHAQPAMSYQRGWLVHEPDDPAAVPMQRFVRLYDTEGEYPFFYLTEDGLYVKQYKVLNPDLQVYRLESTEGDRHGGS